VSDTFYKFMYSVSDTFYNWTLITAGT